jgi:hypothetical protein
MIREFVHPELGRDVNALAGHYTPLEIRVRPYRGRSVLYLIGNVSLDSYCCGTGNWNYVQIPGFLLREVRPGAEDAPAVSEIETIENEDDRQAITTAFAREYPGARIEMW